MDTVYCTDCVECACTNVKHRLHSHIRVACVGDLMLHTLRHSSLRRALVLQDGMALQHETPSSMAAFMLAFGAPEAPVPPGEAVHQKN